ncbi:hypothetical protein Tco_0009668 [Tanacetum coccineum]
MIPIVRTQVPTAINKYLGSTLGDTLQKALQKHTEELRQELSQKDVSKTIEINQQESYKDASQIIQIKMEHATKKELPKHSAKPFDQAAKAEFEQKEILFKMMRESKSYEKHPTHQALYDALIRKTSKDAEPSKKPKSIGSSKGNDMGNTDEKPKVEAVTKDDWKPTRPPTPNPEWNTRKSVDDAPEQNFFFNNDLEYLRGGSTDRKYWASKTSEEIVIRRADQKLYKFMEGDFPRLHLNDIKDMLLLVVQNRLNNLKGDVIVDLEVALCMYTRRIVIQKRVEDLQLGVKSYQKKLNISKPQTRDIDISFKELYTTH